jgi:hypothetical protein
MARNFTAMMEQEFLLHLIISLVNLLGVLYSRLK